MLLLRFFYPEVSLGVSSRKMVQVFMLVSAEYWIFSKFCFPIFMFSFFYVHMNDLLPILIERKAETSLLKVSEVTLLVFDLKLFVFLSYYQEAIDRKSMGGARVLRGYKAFSQAFIVFDRFFGTLLSKT